ncbi:hypothetical protein QBC35DRAFT_63020 [Podospora australis]|uniref:Secreted protein n=1 Tax=Podospora australis TaxID=1536484 RepID=A0AAN7AMB2_9PEZI|nr:hypothetical protein QBC35DRAFT_63020 [Podospora australis]
MACENLLWKLFVQSLMFLTSWATVRTMSNISEGKLREGIGVFDEKVSEHILIIHHVSSFCLLQAHDLGCEPTDYLTLAYSR